VGDFDSVKAIFEALMPRQLRHSMGEFYTPDWLADFVVTEITAGDSEAHTRRFIDPTCGSGTFLFTVVRKFAKSNPNILKKIVGVDINPLSALAAKTNYILFCDDAFLECNKPFAIPVFDGDVLNSATPRQTEGLFDNPGDLSYEIGGNRIKIPAGEYTIDDYVSLAKERHGVGGDALREDLRTIYAQIDSLPASLTAAALSQFGVLCVPRADYAVGNPPWVNWEYLPKEYRARHRYVWQRYELFDYRGMNSIFVKEDISSLVTYVTLDRFVEDGGKLGFVIKEPLFKSSKHGAGFRKFYLANTRTHLQPYSVHDLTRFRPFPGINNRTAVMFVRKGEQARYPVAYTVWEPRGRISLGNYSRLAETKGQFNFLDKKARPVDKDDPTSGWISISGDIYRKLNSYLGGCDYKARTGTFTGGANGIYWLEILEDMGHEVLVRNITERAKIKFEQVTVSLEKAHVYPLITGSDLNLWGYDYRRYILCPHTRASKMYPLAPDELKPTPKVLDYLHHFRRELEGRKGFTSFDKAIHDQFFYALQRIGEYTFAPYKVAWRYICKSFTVAVIERVEDRFLGARNLVPNEKLIYIGLDDKDEAYYLCGVLSSSVFREIIDSFTVSIQIAPRTIDRLKLARFDRENEIHRAISEACWKGHRSPDKTEHLKEIDRLVEQLYAI